jgi:hypothetical protein
MAGGSRAGVDAVARCPAAVHEGLQEVDPPLEGPQLALHRYDRIEPSADIAALIDEIDRDPTGIFWG